VVTSNIDHAKQTGRETPPLLGSSLVRTARVLRLSSLGSRFRSFIMFNAPRPAQRYTGSTSIGGSFVDSNPLSSSVYDDGLDPWSSAPSPVPTPIPQAPASVFSAVIGQFNLLSLLLPLNVKDCSGCNCSVYLPPVLCRSGPYEYWRDIGQCTLSCAKYILATGQYYR